MLDSDGFNLWAGDYDASVKEADENNEFPFAGYTKLMTAIYTTIMKGTAARVLDIGFGTGFLTSKLYDAGNEITGIDFSREMIQIAATRMPNAKLIQWDFALGIPAELLEEKFHFIVSTYALHHLEDRKKADFIQKLLGLLAPNGVILIGDIGFFTRADLLACQARVGHDSWDEDEFYFVFSEIEKSLAAICKLSFHSCSYCAGMIEIRLKE